MDPVERIKSLEITIKHQAEYINDLEREIDRLRWLAAVSYDVVDTANGLDATNG